jgi:hypothetical protein
MYGENEGASDVNRKSRREFLLGSAAVTAMLLAGCGEPTPGGGGRYSLYLSTDDGPLNGSGNIDAVIRETGVPLAAFVVGKHARSERYKTYLDAYRDNPHITLANHSYSHADGHYTEYYRHPGHVLEDFEKNRKLLGLRDRRGRLPGRDSWRLGGRSYDADRSATAAADLLARNGYTLYGWDLEWTHTQSGRPIGGAREIYARILAHLERGHTFTPGHLMLLLHDQMFSSLRARTELKKLILLLKNDPRIRLRPLADYPLRAPAPRLKRGAPRLIRKRSTGVGETSPVDPLKFTR